MKKVLNIAIIGQGRSGRDIHGTYLLKDEAKELFKVVAVVEKNAARRQRAKEEFGCDVYEDYTELFGRSDIDFVVNSSFSYCHFPITLDLLEHKFNVLVEKPFGRYAMDCERMMNAAKENGVMLTVFQQTRFAPFYLRAKEIIDSGVLGKLQHVHLCYNGFSRRWDWQCSQRFCGGALLNSGPHPMDVAIDIMDIDEMPNVFSCMKQVNTSGDAEDYAKVILTAPGKPLVDVDVNCCDGYSDYYLKVCGDRGTLRSTYSNIKWKYFEEGQPLPALDLETLVDEDGVSPSYCKDNLIWHEQSEDVEGNCFDVAVKNLYENIYGHLVNGEPLKVKNERVALQIKIIELAHAQNPMPVKF